MPPTLFRTKRLAVVLAVTSLGSLAVFAHTAGAPEPLLALLKTELDREFGALRQTADPKPYYLAYEVVEQQTHTISATLGALMEQVDHHGRGFDTTIRVGSPEFDNYHPYKGSRVHFTNFSPLSLTDDPNQIRRALWAETDRVYRSASRRYLQLKTDQQLIAQDKTQAADFSAETPQTDSHLPGPLPFDAATWAPKVRRWSAEFRSHGKVLGSNVTFNAQREVRTLVNTEGTAVQDSNNLYRLEVNGLALAPDGMDLRTFDAIEVSDLAHMPDDTHILARVRNVAAQLDALVQAPPAEPMFCPAILSGRASAVFFHEIFGHRVEGHRQKDITDGQTFTGMLGQPVLPSFISVESDPTLRTFEGSDLIGHYQFDDEGVKARPVQVVQDGVLKTFLLSRSPVGEFKSSNGHGRRQPGMEVVSRQSNLIVKSSRQVSEQELRAELISEIKRQNKPYGLYFEEVSSGYTTTGRQGLQAFTVVPLLVYRVFADGRPDELIRGVDIVGTPLSSFQKIVATSNRSQVFNGYCGAESGSVPVSAVSPAILVSEIETQKKQNVQGKLPLLPPPGGER